MTRARSSGSPRAADSGPTTKRVEVPTRQAFLPPCPPSWINRFVDWVDRLPEPAGLYYLGAAVLLASLQPVIQWSAGTYPVGEVDLFNVLVAVTVSYQVGLMHYLIRTSEGSFWEFRPALHAHMDRGQPTQMGDLNNALAGVEIERAAFEPIPTWPWERGTLRGLVAARVVPVLIWLAQFALQRILVK